MIQAKRCPFAPEYFALALYRALFAGTGRLQYSRAFISDDCFVGLTSLAHMARVPSPWPACVRDLLRSDWPGLAA